MIQWVRVHAANHQVTGLIPGQETRVPHAKWFEQKNKQTKKPNLILELGGEEDKIKLDALENKNFISIFL